LICIKGLAAALLAKSNCCCVWHYAIQSDGGAPSERPLFSYRQQIGWFAFSLEMQAIGRIQGLKPIGDAPRCREMEASVKTVDIIFGYGASETAIRPLPSDSSKALLRLAQGNKSFAELLDHVKDESGIQQVIPVDPRDLGLVSGSGETPKQRPSAAILGCSDARVPVELIFNEGPNDLFVVRVAGNGLGTEVLVSLKYAVENLGSLKLIVVLGHSGCGALSTGVDVFLSPGDYLPLPTKHSLRNILDRLLLVVQTSARKLLAAFGPEVVHRPGYRKALIEVSIVTNAALAAYSIQQEFGAGASTELRTVYGVYLLETREVWAPCIGCHCIATNAGCDFALP
jgi:carbonic anhydrase